MHDNRTRGKGESLFTGLYDHMGSEGFCFLMLLNDLLKIYVLICRCSYMFEFLFMNYDDFILNLIHSTLHRIQMISL